MALSARKSDFYSEKREGKTIQVKSIITAKGKEAGNCWLKTVVAAQIFGGTCKDSATALPGRPRAGAWLALRPRPPRGVAWRGGAGRKDREKTRRRNLPPAASRTPNRPKTQSAEPAGKVEALAVVAGHSRCGQSPSPSEPPLGGKNAAVGAKSPLARPSPGLSLHLSRVRRYSRQHPR